MKDDCAELPIHWEDMPEGSTVDLWVTPRDDDRDTFVLADIRSAVRYQGWWKIDYLMHDMRATALIPASEVFMFSVVENWPRRETHEEQRAGEEIP